jgi:purine-binding chemotaxis protein CheW
MSPNAPQTTLDVLILRAGTDTCAMPSERIAELILIPALIRVPGQPSILDGFLNLRGTAIPVISLQRLFHQQAPEPGLHTPLLVLTTSTGPLALRVDRLEEVAAIDGNSLLPYASMDSLNECATAQFEWNGQAVALLSPERLLLVKERECLADLQAQTQQRLESLQAAIT